MSHFASGMISAVSNLSDGPAPTFVSASANGYGTSASMPSGWSVGDLLMIFATGYKLDTSCTGHNTPAGWTELGNWTNKYSTLYMSRTKVFYRIAQSGDSTVSLSVPGGETGYNSIMMAFRGVNTASPFEAMETLNNQSAAATIPYAQITTLGINRVAVQAISSWNPGGVYSTPYAGWTELFDTQNAIGTAVDMRTFASAGLTSAGSQTRTGSYDWGRMAFAIKPAPA
ncbi:MAG: hypothetical protein R3D69_08485 [Xanthobacteraceae bacterium]